MNKSIVMFLSLILLVPLVGTASAADTIRIGLLAPLSHQVGEGQVNAANMAVKRINEAGGVNGKKVELFIEDTEIKPEKAINGYKKLVMVDKVDAVVGAFSSGVVLSLMDHIARYKVPFIATASSSNTLGEKVAQDYERNKYFFRLMLNETDQAKDMVTFVSKFLGPKLGIKKIAVMAEDAKWTALMASMFIEDIEKEGIEVAEYIRFPFKETDYAPILSRVKNKNVDFLVEISSIADGAIYINQWHDMQGPPIAGCNTSAGSEDFWDKTNGKGLSETVFMYGAYDVDLTPLTRKFWKDYINTYGIEPKYSSGFTYDAISLIVEAVEKADSVKADALVGALEKASHIGVSGLIEFKSNHETICNTENRPTMIWHQWQEGGKRLPVYPEKFAQTEYILSPWWKKNK
jgi:branched-chain amino acid transport system substrate-binding protein